MSTVLINDEYLHDIADSIRKMKRTSNPITTDSMAGEIDGIDIGYDPDEKWERPLDWPDYSQIDISNFEGMYFTYDTRYADNRTEWVGLYCVSSGGYKVERGQIVNGEFVAEQSTTKSSGQIFYEWIPTTVTGYVVYRITAATGNPITSIGMRDLPTSMTGDGRSLTFYYQRVLERYGKLPNLTTFSNWGNVNCKSDTILDLKKVTSFYQTWVYSYSIENIDLTGYDSKPVGWSASFCYCKQLRYLNNTDKFVTSSCTTMYQMFYDCNNIRYIDSSTWDTSNVTNMQQSFAGCNTLYYLDVSGWNTSNVTTFYTTFNQCNKLRYLDVSGFDTSKVTTMYGMFGGLHRVEQLDLSNFNTSLVTNMAYMFNNMYCIKSIDCSNFDTGKVTTMAYMFTSDRNLEYLNISSFDTSKVTTVQQMFYNCNGLKNLDVSNFDFSSCTNFADFMDGASFTQRSYNIDLSTATAAITTVNYIFYGNFQLREMDMTGMNLSGITNPVYMFTNNYAIEKVILPSSLHSISTNCFNGCRSLKTLVIPSTTLVTLAATNAFASRNNCPLTIYVPDDLVSQYQAATNWKSLTYVTFAGLSTYTD